MSNEEHLAFSQRLPEMLLAQEAGLWPKGQDRDSWSSGTAHCPQSEGRLAASALLIPTLGALIWKPLSGPCLVSLVEAKTSAH